MASNAKSSTAKPANPKDETSDKIMTKLREIRNKAQNVSSPAIERELIEKSVEQLVKHGLSLTEAIEYEANQSRIKQLQNKMNKDRRPNQYMFKDWK